MDHIHFLETLDITLPTWKQIVDWLIPVGIIIIGAIFGFIAEKIVSANIRKLNDISHWKISEIAAKALKGMPFIWLTLLGVYEAAFALPAEGFQGHIHKIVTGLFIFSLVIVIARVSSELIKSYVARLAEVIGSTSIFIVVTQLIIYIIGALVILQTMGISIMPILTALGVGGLAISLALQDTLANFFSGIYVVLSRQITVGDYIKLDSGEEGNIVDISWRCTTIQEITKNIIIVPNTKIASAILVNYYQPQQEMYARITVGVSYNEDLEKVEKITLEVIHEILNEHYETPPELEPRIRFHTFNDSSIDFNVMFPTKKYFDKFVLQHKFVKKLHARYNDEGINIPFPIRTLDIPDWSEGKLKVQTETMNGKNSDFESISTSSN